MTSMSEIWPNGYDVIDASNWFGPETPGYVVIRRDIDKAIYTGMQMSVWKAIHRLASYSLSPAQGKTPSSGADTAIQPQRMREPIDRLLRAADEQAKILEFRAEGSKASGNATTVTTALLENAAFTMRKLALALSRPECEDK